MPATRPKRALSSIEDNPAQTKRILVEDEMAPEQAKLVTDSFSKFLPMASVTADLFYYRLFEIAPEVRSLFPDDLIAQKKKFITMLSTMVTNLNEVEKIAPMVEDLGMRHVAYGVTAKHYEPFGAALLWTLEESLGVDFTPPVRAAWTEAYKTLAGIMTRAAANLPPPKIAC
jgi:hemoglobin-like flavoprotein